MNRREFIRTSALFALMASTSLSEPLAQTSVERLPWKMFVEGPHYPAFVGAIRRMRAIQNPEDPNGWLYWANVHEDYCPHGTPYFLAWHRGYLYLFEQKLIEVSKEKDLRLPYWDYYSDPEIPTEFTSSLDNPLYVGRVSTDVSKALDHQAFSGLLVDFQRGQANAFEPSIERLPHNQVHNLIGGHMATMQSPQDPIFWLHHANIDRLWSAWVQTGGGRKMPERSSSYWRDRFQYAPDKYVDRVRTISTQELGYFYKALTLPKAAAQPHGATASRRRIVAQPAMSVMSEHNVQFSSGPLILGNQLTEVSATLPTMFTSSAARETTSRSIVVTIFDPNIIGEGGEGGYFYKIHVVVGGKRTLIGTLGPFELAALQHSSHESHSSGHRPISFEIADDSRDVQVLVEFERVNARGVEPQDVISIGNIGVQVSSMPKL